MERKEENEFDNMQIESTYGKWNKTLHGSACDEICAAAAFSLVFFTE